MELFRLSGVIDIDNKKANQALEETSQTGQKTESKLGKFFSGIGKGAAIAGKVIGTGMIAAGTAMGTLTVKAMNLGGELEQNMSGSEAVFGKHAGKMQETAKTAFSNMGLSTSDYLATANKMGALFQGAGFDIEESMGLSSDAMQRAADVASIMGIDTSAAMEAIAGAAKGNFTMMDNLGVAMNDTTLQAYALEKGIDKTTREMTNQEKIGLAMEMFMEKTAYAAGNYAKENETLAGSFGTAKSALNNFLDGSGDVNQLVDAFSNAAKVIVKNLEELSPRLISGITDIINQIMPMLPPLINQLLPVIIEGAVSLINGLVDAMPAVVSAIMAALPALIDGIVQIVNALIEALPQMLQLIIDVLPTLIPTLIDGLVSMIVTLASNITQIIQPLIEAMPLVITAIIEALLSNLPQLLEAGANLLKGLLEGMISFITNIPSYIAQIFKAIWNGICNIFGIHSPSTVMMEIGKSIMEGLFEGIKSLLEKIVEIWNNLKEITFNAFNSIKNALVNVWNSINSAISNALNAIKNTITAVWNAVKDAFTTVWNACLDIITTVWDSIKTKITTMLDAIRNVITTVWNSIRSTISSVLNAIKTIVSDAWSAVKSKITTVLGEIKAKIAEIWDSIKEKISSVLESVKDTVSKILEDIKGKVTEIFNAVKETVSGILDNISNKFKDIFDAVKKTVSDAIGNVKTSISDGIENAKETVSGILDNISDKFKDIFDTVKETVSKAIDTIKGYFNFEWSLPHLKLPHFNISGEFSLDPPSVPHIGVEWYAKAMDNPMIMNSPAIFGYNVATGQFMGGGEAGSEVVSGTNTLMNMIRDAVSGQNETLVVVLYKILDAILSLDENMGGNLREALAGTALEVNRREFGRLVKAVN